MKDIKLCLILVAVLLSPGCGSGGVTGPRPSPSPPPGPVRMELYSYGSPINGIGCAGARVNVPLRSEALPNGPVSGTVDAQFQWTPVYPGARVDAYFLKYYSDNILRCDIERMDAPGCPDILSSDVNPAVNPKRLSYNTKESSSPSNALILLCNRGPATTVTIVYSIGFTPDN